MNDEYIIADESSQQDAKDGMALFSELVTSLGSSTKTLEKQDALVNYFSLADDKDKVWVIALFSGEDQDV